MVHKPTANAILQFSPRTPNHARAFANWERKSSYLLREIVKFGTYIDSLTAAHALKEKIYAERSRGEPLTKGVSADELAARVTGSGGPANDVDAERISVVGRVGVEELFGRPSLNLDAGLIRAGGAE